MGTPTIECPIRNSGALLDDEDDEIDERKAERSERTVEVGPVRPRDACGTLLALVWKARVSETIEDAL